MIQYFLIELKNAIVSQDGSSNKECPSQPNLSSSMFLPHTSTNTSCEAYTQPLRKAPCETSPPHLLQRGGGGQGRRGDGGYSLCVTGYPFQIYRLQFLNVLKAGSFRISPTAICLHCTCLIVEVESCCSHRLLSQIISFGQFSQSEMML